MSPIDVCICAEGSLPADEISELADLGLRSHVEHVVLDGTVVDQAALIGVLERLRRAGLRIHEMTPGRRQSPDRAGQRAVVSVVGLVGEMLSAALDKAEVTEEPATTTAEVPVSCTDDLFNLLHRLEALGLDLRALHLDRSAVGLPPQRHDHLR